MKIALDNTKLLVDPMKSSTLLARHGYNVTTAPLHIIMLSNILKRSYELVLIAFILSIFIPFSFARATTATAVYPLLYYTFNSSGTLYEADNGTDSSSGYWWLNSGAKLILNGSIGQTVHGALSSTDPWAIMYAASSPTDTDGGVHPQNLFRLVSRSTWENVHVQANYKIDADEFSSSSNRNQSNGLLLMLRYHPDGQTLYYAGIRVDGTAVLKKKINGVYYTMAQKVIFPGTYSIASKVNLLPHNAWLNLGADTVTNSNGSVTVNLYLTKPGETTPTKILTAIDSGQYGGTTPITGADFVGIRTDFMDISFDNFEATKI